MTDFLKRNQLFLFFLPILLWLGYFLSFNFPKPVLLADAEDYFIYLNYYLNNIMRGVYPMWNPFDTWGRPEGLWARSTGELNPFLYLAVVLNRLGVPFSWAYFIFLVSYFFLGLTGFYLLVGRLFHDKRVSYISFVLLLFSTLGYNPLIDTIIVLLFVPGVWFIYFLVAFTQTGSRTFFVGLTFAAMMVVMTYLPFHLLTIFLSLVFFFCVLFYRDVPKILKDYTRFFKENKITVALCLGAFCVALIPGLLWYQMGASGEYVIPWRHAVDSPTHVADLSLPMINISGFIGFEAFYALLADLENTRIGAIYIPVFVFIILSLGLIVPLSRKLFVIFAVGFFILLISLTNITPVHKFLYDHIFFFRLFRNLHFYLFLIMIPVFVLFAAGQMGSLLNYAPRNKREKAGMAVYLLLVHGAFALFLFLQDKTIFSSYLTVLLSFIFFTFFFLRPRRLGATATLFCLFILAVIQPMEVFYYIHKNSKSTPPFYETVPFAEKFNPKDKSFPVFSFIRPLRSEEAFAKEIRGYNDSADASGFLKSKYRGTQWSYFLHENVRHDILEEYTRYKFVVYDEAAWKGADTMMPRPSQRQVIRGNSERFQVEQFDFNFIKFKTNFDKKKLLVYHDSFHSGWQAFVNNKPVELLRANVAFKGLWLPAGENTVYLRYQPFWRHALNFLPVMVFPLFLFYLIYLWLRWKN